MSAIRYIIYKRLFRRAPVRTKRHRECMKNIIAVAAARNCGRGRSISAEDGWKKPRLRRYSWRLDQVARRIVHIDFYYRPHAAHTLTDTRGKLSIKF